jgi:hypothetical protein
MVTLQSASIEVLWVHDPSVDGLRLIARPSWSVERMPLNLAWSQVTKKWWDCVDQTHWTYGPYHSLTIRLWLPLLTVAVPTGMLWWLDRRRIPPGHCQKCGYHLTGNVSGRCPECGATVEKEEAAA